MPHLAHAQTMTGRLLRRKRKVRPICGQGVAHQDKMTIEEACLVTEGIVDLGDEGILALGDNLGEWYSQRREGGSHMFGSNHLCRARPEPELGHNNEKHIIQNHSCRYTSQRMGFRTGNRHRIYCLCHSHTCRPELGVRCRPQQRSQSRDWCWCIFGGHRFIDITGRHLDDETCSQKGKRLWIGCYDSRTRPQQLLQWHDSTIRLWPRVICNETYAYGTRI